MKKSLNTIFRYRPYRSRMRTTAKHPPQRGTGIYFATRIGLMPLPR